MQCVQGLSEPCRCVLHSLSLLLKLTAHHSHCGSLSLRLIFNIAPFSEVNNLVALQVLFGGIIGSMLFQNGASATFSCWYLFTSFVVVVGTSFSVCLRCESVLLCVIVL